MGFFTLISLRQAIQQEILRRARPEISTLVRNMEALLRQAENEVASLSVSEDMRMALLSKDSDIMNAFLKSLLMRSHFHSLEVFNKKGASVFQSKQNAEKKWQEFFYNLNPRSPEERKPANSTNSKQSFVFSKTNLFLKNNSKILHPRFLSEMKKKGFWWTYTQNQSNTLPLSYHYFSKLTDKNKNFLGVLHTRIDTTPEITTTKQTSIPF
jgi:hypothetical protein